MNGSLRLTQNPLIRAFLIALVSMGSVGSASACPVLLREAMTNLGAEKINLCALSDRYEKAREVIRGRGIPEPDRIADVIAPRFINLPDWERAKKFGKSNPWKIYRPVPKTWGQWEVGRETLDGLAHRNEKAGVVIPLRVSEITALHSEALAGLVPHPGEFRTYTAIGVQYLVTDAISRAEIQKLYEPAFMTPMAPGQRLVDWIPTRCVDEAQFSRPNQPKPPGIPRTQYFRDAKGVERQCGYYLYSTKPRDVPQALGVWADRSAEVIEKWTNDPLGNDLIDAVAKIERWFIAIHPFSDGNGRMSRYILDYYLESVGLPTPILANQNADLTLRESEWSEEIVRGMVRHVGVLEACARQPLRVGCETVEHTAPFVFFWEK